MKKYIIAHWRGDHSLARSFWINNAILNIALYAILLFLVEYGESRSFYYGTSVWWLLTAFILLALAILILYFWQVVGLWRSAGKHIAKYNKRLWPIVVRVILVLGVIAVIVDSFKQFQVAKELFEIATGDEEFGETEVELIDGDQLYVGGYITFDVFERVEQVLKSNPNIYLIQLDSAGGRVEPARWLRDLVVEYGLETFSAAGCLSACTIPFMAGSVRSLHVDAQMGFHRYSYSGLGEDDMLEDWQIDRDYFQSRGTEDWFLDKVQATDHEEMWYPSFQDLYEQKFVTHFYDDNHGDTEAGAYCEIFICDR